MSYLLHYFSLEESKKMPASLSVIAYITQQTVESINEYNIQKGLAYCRLPDNNSQLIRFTYFVPEKEEDTEDSDDENESSTGHALQLETVYLLHGKFSYLMNDDSLDMIIMSHVHLTIEMEHCPASPLIARFIGKTINSPSATTMEVCITVGVTEYLRKGERPTNEIVITHPTNGRLSKSITAAPKNATVQFTGILTIHEKIMYCDVLDFSFVGTRADNNHSTQSPWTASSTTKETKSSAGKRAIAAHTESKTNSITVKKEGKKRTHDSSPSKIASSVIVVEEENTNNNDNNNEDDDDETSTEVAPAKPQKRRRAK